MSSLKVRAIDHGELEGMSEVLLPLPRGNAAWQSLCRLGAVSQESLKFGDGWAAAVEVDGTDLVVRGEPVGEAARWSIYAAPQAEGALHAARKLNGLIAS